MRLIGCLVVALTLKWCTWWLVFLWTKTSKWIISFLRRVLSFISCVVLEFGMIGFIFLGWGCIKALRLSFDWSIAFLILAFPLELKFRNLRSILLNVWLLFLYSMRGVECIVAGLHHMRVIVSLQGLLLHLLPLLRRNRVGLIELAICCMALKSHSFLRAFVLLAYIRPCLPQLQISHTHLESYFLDLARYSGFSNVFLRGVRMANKIIKWI